MKRTLTMLTILAGLGLSSCQAGRIENGQTKLPPGASAGYLDKLSSDKTVTMSSALKGMLLLVGQEKELSFAEAAKDLQERKVVPADWVLQPDQPVTKGQVAYMLFHACGMRGGLTLWMIRPCTWSPLQERYCLMEMQYQGFMSAGTPYNTVTGMEYVAILSRADEYRATGKVSSVLTEQGGAGEVP